MLEEKYLKEEEITSKIYNYLIGKFCDNCSYLHYVQEQYEYTSRNCSRLLPEFRFWLEKSEYVEREGIEEYLGYLCKEGKFEEVMKNIDIDGCIDRLCSEYGCRLSVTISRMLCIDADPNCYIGVEILEESGE